MIKRILFFATSIVLLPICAFSWADHYLGVIPSLKVMPEINDAKPVRAESLESFLLAQEKGLEKVLNAEEKWARKNLPEYAPCPDSLTFKATGEKRDIRDRFLHAIRVNPDAKLHLFKAVPPGQIANCKNTIPFRDISKSIDDISLLKHTFCLLREGNEISALETIASASNEPDYDLDIGLWEDNGTPFGLLYGFGKQPFGNPKLPYSTRSPFHMGFYHEPMIINVMAPFLRRTYPQYRIHLYNTLAKFAFKTGHPYWGYRFMGWGLHILQDLTQPYHTTPVPGTSVPRLLWINLQDILGFPKAKNDIIQLVSNRHQILEDFQRGAIRAPFKNNNLNDPLLSALADTERDASYGPFNDDYSVNVVAKESNEKADAVDTKLRESIPSKYVNDPSYDVDTGVREERVYDKLLRSNPKTIKPLIDVLIDLFTSFGAHSRNYVRSILHQP